MDDPPHPDSQLSATISAQSLPVASRAELEKRWAAAKAELGDGPKDELGHRGRAWRDLRRCLRDRGVL